MFWLLCNWVPLFVCGFSVSLRLSFRKNRVIWFPIFFFFGLFRWFFILALVKTHEQLNHSNLKCKSSQTFCCLNRGKWTGSKKWLCSTKIQKHQNECVWILVSCSSSAVDLSVHEVWEWISNICLCTSMSATATKHYISTMLPLLLTRNSVAVLFHSYCIIFRGTSSVDTNTYPTHLTRMHFQCESSSHILIVHFSTVRWYIFGVAIIQNARFNVLCMLNEYYLNVPFCWEPNSLAFVCAHIFFFVSLTLSFVRSLSSWADFDLWRFGNNFKMENPLKYTAFPTLSHSMSKVFFFLYIWSAVTRMMTKKKLSQT